MVEREIGSIKATLAVREAEKILRSEPREWPATETRQAAARAGKGLVRGLLAAGFLTLCFLPTVVVLAIVALAIFLAR